MSSYGLNSKQMPPNIRPLSEPLALKAAKELNEVPERIQVDLDAIREWLKKTPHLHARQDDQFLVGFLRSCKYRMERVKEKLDMYYSVRSALPEIIKDRDPLNPKIREIIKLGVSIPLPNTIQPDGERIIWVRVGAYNPKRVKLEEVIQLGTMIHDILNIVDDNFVIGGLVTIVDFANVTSSHMGQLNPTLLRKIFTLYQEASPLRQGGFHFINLPPSFETLYKMATGLLSEKNQQRFVEKFMCHVHGKLEQLHNSIPKLCLPNELGGEAGTIESLTLDLEKRLIANKDYFAEEKQYGVDERKRMETNKLIGDFNGISGTFTKLQID